MDTVPGGQAPKLKMKMSARDREMFIQTVKEFVEKLTTINEKVEPVNVVCMCRHIFCSTMSHCPCCRRPKW